MKTMSDEVSVRETKHRVIKPLTAADKARLMKLGSRPDHEIDTSDIPELPASAWKGAVRGRFYVPPKQSVTMRLDADVIAWLKKKAGPKGRGYQTVTNQFLRRLMLVDTAAGQQGK